MACIIMPMKRNFGQLFIMPVYLGFLQVAENKLQLALCGSNLTTLLELVKPHNTC